MGSNADAQKAVSMLNGQNMGGRDLRVSIARPREEGGGGGGGRGGSYGNRGGNRSGGGGGGGNRRDY
jgi:RNA recognition motif-containing protein